MVKVQLIAAICVAAASFLSPLGWTTQALAREGGHHDSGGQSGETGREEHFGDSTGGGGVGTSSGDAGDHRNVADRRSDRSDDHRDDCFHPERQYDRTDACVD